MNTNVMKKLIAFFLIAILCTPAIAQGYKKTANGIKAEVGSNIEVEIQYFSPSIVRVLKYPKKQNPKKESLSVIKKAEEVNPSIEKNGNVIILSSSELKTSLNLLTGAVSFKCANNGSLLMENDNASSFTSKEYDSGKTTEVKQVFTLSEQEAIYGLGQHQQGYMNQRGKEVQLKQKNTEIAIPIIHSTKGYALFWDNYSPTTYKDTAEDGLSFTSSSGNCIDYYFMYGKNADGTIAEIRELTGQAPMFPLWTYGFWQSRERYTSQDEIVGVVKQYRDLGVPLDGIVQDWQYWGTDNKRWNAVEFGNPNFPDPKKMVDDIHSMNAHIIISVWPFFGPETNIYKDLSKRKLLFDYDVYPQNNGVRAYDTFSPKAREIYWNYMNKNLLSLGVDGWWLDATEAESKSGDEAAFNQKSHLGPLRDVFNAYPLSTVGGVYDAQRKVVSDKRVFILTRSAFAGQQRYGANAWSGDIDSRWSVLRNQISAGLNFSLCGIPYWNTDIGGFFANRVYPKGINDISFHELYVRWFQFATFTPMMRSHGTNTPREIFKFGERGDWAFDVQEKFINIRYRLLPYLYSSANDITSGSGTMMRALSMDFSEDAKVHDINNQYMFGKSLLVIPVTDSMYVDRQEAGVSVDMSAAKVQKVYLPKGADWYDFWTGEKIRGGQEITKAAPIDIIPLYVKAGTILPWGPKVQYAEEKKWDDLCLYIYPGEDAEFVLYEDENDNYNYEKGLSSTIKITWNDESKTLAVSSRKGEFPGMLKTRKFNITLVNPGKNIDSFVKPGKTIQYEGAEVSIKF